MRRKRTPTEDDLSPVDRAALELAIEHDLTRSDAATRQQIKAKLREESWLDVAMFCAYGRQCTALRLSPWQPAPCQVEIDYDDGNGGPIMGRRAAAELLRKMLSLGISRWHPDPLTAIDAAEAERAQHVKTPRV
jgi:hypothetical protein